MKWSSAIRHPVCRILHAMSVKPRTPRLANPAGSLMRSLATCAVGQARPSCYFSAMAEGAGALARAIPSAMVWAGRFLAGAGSVRRVAFARAMLARSGLLQSRACRREKVVESRDGSAMLKHCSVHTLNSCPAQNLAAPAPFALSLSLQPARQVDSRAFAKQPAQLAPSKMQAPHLQDPGQVAGKSQQSHARSQRSERSKPC